MLSPRVAAVLVSVFLARTAFSQTAEGVPPDVDKQSRASASFEEAPEADAVEPSPEAKKEAAERFGRGLAFYDDGDYALALIEFERAYQLVPDYRVLYNIGQVSIQLSRASQALRALEQYLAEGADALSPERIESVKRDLEMLEARTSHLSIIGTDGARVIIDDETYGTLPLEGPLLVDAGRHRLEVKRDGYKDYSERLTLAGAERRELSIELQKRPRATPLVTTTTPEVPVVGPPEMTDNTPPPKKGKPWAAISWSATGVLAGGAIASGIVGLNASGKFKNLKGEPNASRSELEDQASVARSWLLAADILGAAAIAAGGVSLYLSVARHGGSDQSETAGSPGAPGETRIDFSPRSVTFTQSF